MLFLSEKDILQSFSYNEVMDAVESALLLYEKGEFQMPHRVHMDKGDNTLLVMPCMDEEHFSTKLVSIFPDNAGTDVPVIDGVVILNCGKTGVPLALINGRILTALRTGAVGGVSIRHMTSDEVKSLGIIGAGVQGYFQALHACAARNINDIYVYDIKPENASVFAKKLAFELPSVSVHNTRDSQELVENSDIVITATTSSSPVIPDNPELLEGKHVIAIGSFKPEMRELPDAIFHKVDEVFVDTEHALEETGELIIPMKKGLLSKSQVKTLGKLLCDKKHQEDIKTKTTFFKSVGMALFDLFAARLVYQKALERGIGRKLEL